MTSRFQLPALALMLFLANDFSLAAQRVDERTAATRTVLRPTTVSRVNQALTNAQRLPAEVLARSTVRHVEPSGRTPADDHAQHYFSDAVKDEVRAILGELDRRGLSGDDTVPHDLHERLEELLRIESCKFLRISTYWGTQQLLGFHRGMVAQLLARALEQERAWAAPRLQALDDGPKALRANLEAEITTCETADPFLIPEGLRGRDLWIGLQDLRSELAIRIDEADSAAGRLRHGKSRGSSCPTPPAEPTGPTSHILMAPDVNAHYPQEAIDHDVTGTVRVRIVYDAGGCVVTASIYRSSGSDLLDQAAMAAAFDTVVAPALKDGVPAADAAVLPLHFNISVDN